ncbi:hypothetical protein EI94DRAFT_1708617 [Lactarius quietus]|nr:hypothetical protein EI94DRAFT_1708617 [Lactarius quietus]
MPLQRILWNQLWESQGQLHKRAKATIRIKEHYARRYAVLTRVLMPIAHYLSEHCWWFHPHEPNKGLYSSPSTTSTTINITTEAAARVDPNSHWELAKQAFTGTLLASTLLLTTDTCTLHQHSTRACLW